MLNDCKYQVPAVVISLIVLVLVCYWPVQQAEFVYYDDVSYIMDNAWIKHGLTWESLKKAFTDIDTGYWHPLAWLSHMLDWQLFRANPAGHLWNNVILHMINVLLLFWLFYKITRDFWKGSFVALLFAIHPLNVESVAWIAERKNVLSTTFWFLTMAAYVFYAEKPTIRRYLLVLMSFILGLMVKPMLVTLPCVLLLLDYWPLGRLRSSRKADHVQPGSPFIESGADSTPQWTFGRLVLEKIPLLFFSVLLSLGTFLAARYYGAVVSLSSLPVSSRLIHCVNSYVTYIRKLFWPTDLAIFYPMTEVSFDIQFICSALLITGVSLFVLRNIKRYPFLFVGWFWFLGTLFPVSGLVQAGAQAMADRYAYVPFIGLFIMLAWGVPEVMRNRQYEKWIYGFTAVILIVSLTYMTRIQVSYWNNSISLYEHALKVTRESDLVHNNLGFGLVMKGRVKEAFEHFQASLRINPRNSSAYNNIGMILWEWGRYDEAKTHFYSALRIKPDHFIAWNNLAIVLAEQGKVKEAQLLLTELLRRKPDDYRALYRMGLIYSQKGNYHTAMEYYRKVLGLRVDDAQTHNNLGFALAQTGKLKEAVYHFTEALKINPQLKEAENNLSLVNQLIRKK